MLKSQKNIPQLNDYRQQQIAKVERSKQIRDEKKFAIGGTSTKTTLIPAINEKFGIRNRSQPSKGIDYSRPFSQQELREASDSLQLLKTKMTNRGDSRDKMQFKQDISPQQHSSELNKDNFRKVFKPNLAGAGQKVLDNNISNNINNNSQLPPMRGGGGNVNRNKPVQQQNQTRFGMDASDMVNFQKNNNNTQLQNENKPPLNYNSQKYAQEQILKQKQTPANNQQKSEAVDLEILTGNTKGKYDLESMGPDAFKKSNESAASPFKNNNIIGKNIINNNNLPQLSLATAKHGEGTGNGNQIRQQQRDLFQKIREQEQSQATWEEEKLKSMKQFQTANSDQVAKAKIPQYKANNLDKIPNQQQQQIQIQFVPKSQLIPLSNINNIKQHQKQQYKDPQSNKGEEESSSFPGQRKPDDQTPASYSKYDEQNIQKQAKFYGDPSSNGQLIQCSVGCGRKFGPEQLQKHEGLCLKSQNKKKKVFDSKQQRMTQEIAEVLQNNGQSQQNDQNSQNALMLNKKKEWKKQSEALRMQMKQAKDGVPLDQEQQKIVDDSQGLTQCRFCSRKFNGKAAERHIPFCEEKFKKTQMVNSGQAKRNTIKY